MLDVFTKELATFGMVTIFPVDVVILFVDIVGFDIVGLDIVAFVIDGAVIVLFVSVCTPVVVATVEGVVV